MAIRAVPARDSQSASEQVGVSLRRLFALFEEQTELVIKITKRPISTHRLSTTTRANNLGGGPFESTYPQVSEYASPRLYYKYFLELNLKY